jgi:hypothetical protein
MKAYFQKTFFLIILFCSLGANGSSISDEAKNRGINETCHSYLSQIEKSYNLNGLNITFAHPENPSIFPSLHISSQKYNNGASSFTATVTPDGKNCYISTIMLTSINDQSCSEVAKIKTKSGDLKSSSYSDGEYIILTPSDNSYQTILTSSGDQSCTITEARMMWPGR